MQNSLSEMGTLYYLYSFSINLKLFKNKAFINNNGNKALTKLRELRILFFIKWGFLTHLFKWFGSILELPIAKSVLMTTALKGGLLQSAGPPGDPPPAVCEIRVVITNIAALGGALCAVQGPAPRRGGTVTISILQMRKPRF